jgi:hypothetical protein
MTDYENSCEKYERLIREYHRDASLGGFSGIPEAVRLVAENAALKEKVAELERRIEETAVDAK